MSQRFVTYRFVSIKNPAEVLVDLGDALRSLMRRGAPLEDAAMLLGLPAECCQLALEFRDAPDQVKLRAMVEDWPTEQIARALSEAFQTTGQIDLRKGVISP